MKTFEFDYDEENDDLFIYLPGKKSAGAVEIGDFVFDFDVNKNLVAVQISDASEVFSKLMSRAVGLIKIISLKVEDIPFRNMNVIRLEVELDSGEKIKTNLAIPEIGEGSPVLRV